MSSHQRARSLGVNDEGRVVGQDHHRAKLTDHDVDLIRELRADGMKLSEIAEKFGTSKGYVHDVCTVRRSVRAHLVMGQRPPTARPRYRFKAANPAEFAYATEHDAE